MLSIHIPINIIMISLLLLKKCHELGQLLMTWLNEKLYRLIGIFLFHCQTMIRTQYWSILLPGGVLSYVGWKTLVSGGQRSG